MKALPIMAVLALCGCCNYPREITKTGGAIYLNGPAYADYMQVGYEYAYFFSPPFHYALEVSTTTNGYRITPDGLLHYGVMSGWRTSGLKPK